MYFILYCRDKEGGIENRMANREAHLTYVAENMDMIKVAGPMFAEDGETMIGSMLIMEAGSRDVIEAWSAKDPYVTGGVFESVEISGFGWTFGAPE